MELSNIVAFITDPDINVNVYWIGSKISRKQKEN